MRGREGEGKRGGGDYERKKRDLRGDERRGGVEDGGGMEQRGGGD